MTTRQWPLRIVLLLTGLGLCVIGLNTALGGMRTLGMQFSPDFLTVTDPLTFARHDSNARFFGGVFAALGAVMAVGAIYLNLLRTSICVILFALFAGGIARLLQSDYSPLTDTAFTGSLIAELVGAPLLALWLLRTRP